MERVWEAPRVTKPYTEAQWREIERLGGRSTTTWRPLDVRLTMGGEPTFVSIDDPDGAEWNTAALGENKRRLAVDLYQRLREHYAPHGPGALRAGQVVSGRAAAALVAQLLLAPRRRADLAQIVR